MTKRRRRLTDGELHDLLELVKLQLHVVLDAPAAELVERSQEIYELCDKVRQIREQIARRAIRKQKKEQPA